MVIHFISAGSRDGLRDAQPAASTQHGPRATAVQRHALWRESNASPTAPGLVVWESPGHRPDAAGLVAGPAHRDELRFHPRPPRAVGARALPTRPRSRSTDARPRQRAADETGRAVPDAPHAPRSNEAGAWAAPVRAPAHRHARGERAATRSASRLPSPGHRVPRTGYQTHRGLLRRWVL